MARHDFDLIVLGSGPAGQKAAIQAAAAAKAAEEKRLRDEEAKKQQAAQNNAGNEPEGYSAPFIDTEDVPF